MTSQQHERMLQSLTVIHNFCLLNSIPKPPIYSFTSRGSYCGYFDSKKKTIFVDPEACAREVKNPAMRSWSHPHYFTDRTIYGVIHHEFGHYVHQYLKYPRLPKEKKITSYEPNAGERFAETIKLFLGNPDLLKAYDPQRFAKLISLGLKPLHEKSWEEIMREDNMSERFITRAKQKISA